MNAFFAKKSLGFYFMAVTFVLTLIGCIVYATADIRENDPAIIACLAVAAVFALAVAIKPIKYLEYVPFILILISLGMFIPLAFDEIGDVLSKINMDGLSVSWYASIVLLVLSTIAEAVETVCRQEKE